uniref:Uncharacterized protein n=1 Tax=Plectus sambesii TaxID=2011161 RepID=A0A914VIC6_9BILA
MSRIRRSHGILLRPPPLLQPSYEYCDVIAVEPRFERAKQAPGCLPRHVGGGRQGTLLDVERQRSRVDFAGVRHNTNRQQTIVSSVTAGSIANVGSIPPWSVRGATSAVKRSQ